MGDATEPRTQADILSEAHAAAEPSWRAFVAAAKDFAGHLDQWEKFQFQTAYGPVYVSIGRAAVRPEDYQDVA